MNGPAAPQAGTPAAPQAGTPGDAVRSADGAVWAPGDAVRSLVGDPGTFWEAHWKRRPAVHHGDPLDVISAEEIRELFDGGLLTWPYFGVLRDGVSLPREAVTTSRRVLNLTVPGFPCRPAIQAEVERGATLVLRHPEHWHAGVRALVAAVDPAFAGEVRGRVLLAPSGGTATENGDDLDQLVVQLSGRAGWTVTGSAGAVGRYDLEPGDVLYVPCGFTRSAVAGDSGSVHLVVEVEEPTPRDIVAVLADDLRHRLASTDLARRHHLMPAGRKAAWVCQQIAEHQKDVDIDAVVRAAVERRSGGAQEGR